MINIKKYLYAIWYLKPIQIYGQIRHRIISKTFSPDYWKKRAEIIELGDCVWNPTGEFLPPGTQLNTAESIKKGKLIFLNIEKNLGYPFNWSAEMSSKLWEYNLHYFEYIFALDYDDAKFIVQNWIENYPLKRNLEGWGAYHASLRLMYWAAYFFHHHYQRTKNDLEFEEKLKQSMALQMIWIDYRLEFHLLLNHYLENLAALILFGSCFNGKKIKKIFNRYLKLFQQELTEQIMDDGMHIERSTMYHCRVVYLLKFLMNTGNHQIIETINPYYEKAITALSKLCHPDRQIALFNDAAFGIYNPPAQLLPKTNVEKTKTFQLSHAGYYGARTENGHYILCDAGFIGPDYNPGHAHGDIFSFELSFFGKRIIVDSGVYDYINSPQRKYCRSTAAHNTVEIDGQDQCEFFDSFKVGYRGYPVNIQYEDTLTGFRLSGEHNGYHRFPSRVTHHRTFDWQHQGILEITDRIEAQKNVSAVCRFHLHPNCHVSEQNENNITILYDNKYFLFSQHGGKLRISQYEYFPEFNTKYRGTVIEVTSHCRTNEIRTSITSILSE
jgi:uncharacterized heparinase superfamily protein